MEHFQLLLAGLKFLQAGHPATRDSREGGRGLGRERETGRVRQTDRQTVTPLMAEELATIGILSLSHLLSRLPPTFSALGFTPLLQ